jgi:L-ascorbate metabolism protein UlaG (beta-lactamase superfamily)
MVCTIPSAMNVSLRVAGLIASAVLVAPVLGWATLRAQDVELRYLGNAGFLVVAGDAKVLVDGLYGAGLAGYTVVPDGVRDDAEAAAGVFAGVDLVLASHLHGDHFDARAVARHLGANGGARFVSTTEAVAALLALDETLAARATAFWPALGEPERLVHVAASGSAEEAGLELTVLRFPHGENPTQNLGLLMQIGGLKLLHLGDTEIGAEEVRAFGLRAEGIDVALVPYWYLVSARWRRALEELGARELVIMHVPAADAPRDYFWPKESFAGLAAAVREAAPMAWLPIQGETRKYNVPARVVSAGR